ncbi:thioredoxin-disulfide reductase [Candidatus Microgenomates bacterium]|nr:thioredoxin-disulfide reductase [Candidatus Microgenomates bacterium]
MEYDIAIIGSGPAGLTAAIYGSRGNAKTLILAGSSWGGQLMVTTAVENYPGFESILGPELMEKMKDHATKFGAEWKAEDVTSVEFSTHPFTLTTSSGTYNAKSIIVAAGASTLWLNLPSEQKLIGRGVSSCAPCDAPFFRDKSVVVVGGGDSAMEEALVLVKYASAVTIVHRRDVFRASKIMQDRVLNDPKIKIVWDSVIEEILGDQKVTGVKIKNVKTNEVSEMPVNGVFVAIGHEPATKIFKGKIELDAKGYVRIVQSAKFKVQNEEGREIGNKFSTMTSVEGVFTAGDVHDFHYKQAVTAAGFGCQAALEALAWLDEEKG